MSYPIRTSAFLAFVETDGCGLDGIAVATGCSVGRRTMRVMDFGKMAATFVDVVTRESIRIVPSAESRIRAKDYMPDLPNRWEAQLHAYQVMPVPELFTVTPRYPHGLFRQDHGAPMAYGSNASSAGKRS